MRRYDGHVYARFLRSLSLFARSPHPSGFVARFFASSLLPPSKIYLTSCGGSGDLDASTEAFIGEVARWGCRVESRAANGTFEEGFLLLSEADFAPEAGTLSAFHEAFSRFKAIDVIAPLVVDDRGLCVSAGARLVNGRSEPLRRDLPISDWRVANACIVQTVSEEAVAIRGRVWPDFAKSFMAPHPLAAASQDLPHKPYGKSVLFYPFAKMNGSSSPQAAHEFPASTKKPALPHAKIVVLDAFLPKPDRDSGSADAFWHLMIFLSLGFQVTFIPAYEDLGATSYVDALRRRGIRVRAADETHDTFETLMEEAADASIVMLSRFPVANDIPDKLRKTHQNTKIIFNTVDLHFLREERAARLANDDHAIAAAAETKRLELGIMRQCDATLVVSAAERELLASEGLASSVHHIAIPRVARRPDTDFEQRDGIIFVGSFDHQPNRDAVTYLLDQVWPLVRQERRDLKLTIVGSNVTPELKARHDPEVGVHVVGYVADLEPVLAKARVSIAPLRYGAGVKGKVVSSLMHGLPCVMTRIASEGLDLRDDEDCLIADTPWALARALIRLHEDPVLWQRLAINGYAAVAERHDINRVREQFATLFASLGISVPAPMGLGFGPDGEFHPDLEIRVALAP